MLLTSEELQYNILLLKIWWILIGDMSHSRPNL